MKRSISTYILMLLILFQVISAVPAGALMIIDPSGEKLGLPIKLLQYSPFSDFLIPGLFLFLVLGVFPGIVLYGLIKKKHFSMVEKINLYKNYHWAWTFSYYVGLLLILWINMQLFFIKSFDIAHFVYSMLGVAIIIITHVPHTKRDYEIDEA
ncbi:hypothetical protein [Aquimarina sp. 2304DJ70-9]|uniref:hypothetical protein n=1 Tax=Aquimarina penaris TaxID=3231044 RepID=UPI003461BBAC